MQKSEVRLEEPLRTLIKPYINESLQYFTKPLWLFCHTDACERTQTHFLMHAYSAASIVVILCICLSAIIVKCDQHQRSGLCTVLWLVHGCLFYQEDIAKLKDTLRCVEFRVSRPVWFEPLALSTQVTQHVDIVMLLV